MSSVSSASAASTDLYHFERLSAARLDELTALEQVAHPHPWSRRHFADALDAANEIQLLCRDHGVVGYFVAMKGVDEVHLLNLAVAPSQRGQGLGQLLLQALVLWSQRQGAHSLWLEVRASNHAALRLYEHSGWQRVGERKNYYPAASGQREHAIVMSLPL